MAETWSVVLSVLLFLALVLSVGVGAVMLKGRLGVGVLGMGRAKRLRLVERLELGDRRFVALVRLDDRELVLGGGLHGVRLLETHAAPVEDPAEPPREPSFVAAFRQVVARRRAEASELDGRQRRVPLEPPSPGLSS